MASINELKGMASSKLGFARSNNFLVELPQLGANPFGRLAGFVPSVPGLTPDATASTRELNVLCKNAQIPGKQILSHDRRIGMIFEKVAYGYAVGDVNLSFYMLNDYSVMNYFDTWKRSVVDEQNLTVGYKKDYARPVKIHQLRKPLKTIGRNLGPISVDIGLGSGSVYSVELVDAFPTTIGQIDFSNELDGLVELNVQLSYSNHVRIKPSQNFINVDFGF